MADSDNESGGHHNSQNESSLKEQDRFLPIANVSRIMKKALPTNAKISKDAKETVQECVSEFISFITGEASDKCQREKRKTMNGDDLLWAMTTLGFEDYVEPLKIYLQRFHDMEGEKAAMSGKGGEKESGGNGSVVNMENSGVGYYDMIGRQGHVYGSSAYNRTAGSSVLGLEKVGSGHQTGSGPSSATARPM
ncbi:nuclear transcription factor Y subunit B-3-like [Olea europaea var. sylvestris]|uniref:Nuclear transcription factor Y subunit B-3-like n=1 Tax=Olea europaea subsp. europaea TaxID=158383 RepID=A0A8S0TG65_OLEEU|nr:nuclear transcription factor Y subunit B-3-like [Olea europaea var. sylvestris]CAA3004433.1 nuclear transcription factor Y subunit B-3-like [Olea europaea subsp. europaea]